MWKVIQVQEESEEPHDGTQQWRIDGWGNSDKFWKKIILKRLQVGCAEKGLRDWDIKHCKAGEYTVQHNCELCQPCERGA